MQVGDVFKLKKDMNGKMPNPRFPGKMSNGIDEFPFEDAPMPKGLLVEAVVVKEEEVKFANGEVFNHIHIEFKEQGKEWPRFWGDNLHGWDAIQPWIEEWIEIP